MYELDEVPFGVGHVLECSVAEDTGVVDEYGDVAECVDGGFDYCCAVCD